MTDREKHISVLQNIDRAYRTFTQEEYRALEYAIASLKTDLKYDLMYEGEEVYTKANLVAMLTEILLEIEELPTNRMAITDSSGLIHYGYSEYKPTAKDASKIIQQKIDKLRGEESG